MRARTIKGASNGAPGPLYVAQPPFMGRGVWTDERMDALVDSLRACRNLDVLDGVEAALKLHDSPVADKPEKLAGMLASVFVGRTEECMAVIPLTRQCRALACEIVSVGSDAYTVCDVKVILRAALAHGAHAFAVAHNHPSGDCLPSSEDLRVTRTLAAGALACGLTLVDHVIWASFKTYSMRAHGVGGLDV